MKKSYKIASAAMLGALGVGLAIASETKASSDTQNGSGRVVFTFKTAGTDTNTLPADSTAPPVTFTTGSFTETGNFQFRNITPLDFQEHDILGINFSAESTYDVEIYKTKELNSANEMSMPHFVRFQDYRTGVDNHYKISAAMTTEFTSGTNALGGKLVYKDVYVGSAFAQIGQAQKPESPLTNTMFTLEPSGASVDVYNHFTAGGGFGLNELVFGTYDKVNTAIAAGKDTYDSVQLVVPAKTSGVVAEGEYTAVITWTMSDTP